MPRPLVSPPRRQRRPGEPLPVPTAPAADTAPEQVAIPGLATPRHAAQSDAQPEEQGRRWPPGFSPLRRSRPKPAEVLPRRRYRSAPCSQSRPRAGPCGYYRDADARACRRSTAWSRPTGVLLHVAAQRGVTHAASTSSPSSSGGIKAPELNAHKAFPPSSWPTPPRRPGCSCRPVKTSVASSPSARLRCSARRLHLEPAAPRQLGRFGAFGDDNDRRASSLQDQQPATPPLRPLMRRPRAPRPPSSSPTASSSTSSPDPGKLCPVKPSPARP